MNEDMEHWLNTLSDAEFDDFDDDDESDDDYEFAEYDDDLDYEDYPEYEDAEVGAEFFGRRARRRRRLRRRRRRIMHARRRRRLARDVRGRRHGVIRTPAGSARMKLPGGYPTVKEFKSTVDTLQKDIKRNATGIKQLGSEQKKDAARLAGMVTRSERRIRKQLKETQVAALVAAAAPLLLKVGAQYVQ